MWIILTQKVPAFGSPPKMSIHWAGANAADVVRQHKQKVGSGEIRLNDYDEPQLLDVGDKFVDNFGYYEPKEDGSVWIIYDTDPVKIWPHEYSVVSDENLKMYLQGSGCEKTASHVPMYGSTPLLYDPMTTVETRQFTTYPRFNVEAYEAALIDGAEDITAFYTSLGNLPKDLWFALIKPYGDMFGLSTSDIMPIFKRENKVYEKIKSGWEEEYDS